MCSNVKSFEVGVLVHPAIMFMNSNKSESNIRSIIQQNRQKCSMAGIALMNETDEAYAKDMSKKISTAIDIKQRQGKFIGCRAAYGYMKSPEDKNQLIVDREVSHIVVRIFECKAEGMGNAGMHYFLSSFTISGTRSSFSARYVERFATISQSCP